MAIVRQTIADFYRVISERDLQRDIQFRLLSISPGGTFTNFDENDLVYARAAKLPARAIGNTRARFMGLNYNIPGISSYPESEKYTLEFYNDINNNLYQKFEDWSRDTFDDGSSTGNYFAPTQSSTIVLQLLNNNLGYVCQYNLVGVSIRNVGGIEYKMADGSGQFVTFSVELSYHYYTRNNVYPLPRVNFNV